MIRSTYRRSLLNPARLLEGVGIAFDSVRKIPGHEKLIEIATNRNPHHRLTTPADLGGAIIALCHPGADWITGNVINVDGGEEISA